MLHPVPAGPGAAPPPPQQPWCGLARSLAGAGPPRLPAGTRASGQGGWSGSRLRDPRPPPTAPPVIRESDPPRPSDRARPAGPRGLPAVTAPGLLQRLAGRSPRAARRGPPPGPNGSARVDAAHAPASVWLRPWLGGLPGGPRRSAVARPPRRSGAGPPAGRRVAHPRAGSRLRRSGARGAHERVGAALTPARGSVRGRPEEAQQAAELTPAYRQGPGEGGAAGPPTFPTTFRPGARSGQETASSRPRSPVGAHPRA